MIIYSTKNCLNDGIVAYDVDDVSVDLIVIRNDDCRIAPIYLHKEGKDWHKTQNLAIERATNIKMRKLISLNKQINKITNIEFLK